MTSLPDVREDLRLARDAVRVAGSAVLEYFRENPDVRFKGPEQPVTAADLEADRLLREALTRARPEYGWLSEESADSPERLDRPRVWVVDPIDGTNSFIEGIPEFVVSVGLVENGMAIAGTLFNPATDELYEGALGRGAFRNRQPIAVAPPPATGRPILLASRSELGEGRFSEYLTSWNVIGLGSTAYRMLKIADGTGHAFFSSSRKAEWDVCAAAVIVAEAGGTVSQINGARLRFNQAVPAFRGIVARGGIATVVSEF